MITKNNDAETIINTAIDKTLEYMNTNVMSPIISVLNTLPKDVLYEYTKDVQNTETEDAKNIWNSFCANVYKKLEYDITNNRNLVYDLYKNISCNVLAYQFNI